MLAEKMLRKGILFIKSVFDRQASSHCINIVILVLARRLPHSLHRRRVRGCQCRQSRLADRASSVLNGFLCISDEEFEARSPTLAFMQNLFVGTDTFLQVSVGQNSCLKAAEEPVPANFCHHFCYLLIACW